MTSLFRSLQSCGRCASLRGVLPSTSAAASSLRPAPGPPPPRPGGAVPARCGSETAQISHIRRSIYGRTYRTLLVLPDGSTMYIRYPEPRRIIKLPVDLNAMSEQERRIRIMRRAPREKRVEEITIDDNFDAGKYLRMRGKKK